MKTLGEASTDAERLVEAALADAAPWAERPLRYRPVTGGISNMNWRVEVEGDPRPYFVKLPGRGTEMFIDRAAARAASRQAEAIGLGPRTFDYLDHADIEIAEFVDGRRASTHRDFADPALRAEAMRVYRRFHDAPLLPLTKTVFDMIDEHDAQVAALGGVVPADHAWLQRQVRLARQALEASGLDLVPCFNDPMPGNFLIGADGSILLIDFEYASNNDRIYDLGIWSGEMFFPESIDRELIELYFGRYEEALYARLVVHKALADVKWSTWAMVQNKISTLDFDFYKYGVWKHMRARSIMSDPRWPAYLKAL
ncbi:MULTISPECIES: phosphotransferase [unclassified Aureimonas]|uniref:phosphotransferase n=1 Tax=unclassified Aureimonas TaxID=2615206 RepID=UPI0006F1D1E1|nr:MULTISPECIES: phosphotransferase [unclassified Aureimonas]KQT52494.1 choline kinase [Aureimonas sp. Leaf427]KQT77605.1 choline kinase [Aureimonas sp. Leaf460]